jgi:hypothetical protein
MKTTLAFRPQSQPPAKTRQRGNPNWGKPPEVKHASTPTEFELRAQSLRLNESNYANSDVLRAWCKANKNRCYVPEWLLKRWDMAVDISF